MNWDGGAHSSGTQGGWIAAVTVGQDDEGKGDPKGKGAVKLPFALSKYVKLVPENPNKKEPAVGDSDDEDDEEMAPEETDAKLVAVKGGNTKKAGAKATQTAGAKQWSGTRCVLPAVPRGGALIHGHIL